MASFKRVSKTIAAKAFNAHTPLAVDNRSAYSGPRARVGDVVAAWGTAPTVRDNWHRAYRDFNALDVAVSKHSPATYWVPVD